MRKAISLCTLLTLLAASSLFAGSIPSRAVQLIQNGNFATGDFTGWNHGGSGTTYYDGSGSDFYVNSGSTAPVSGYGTAGSAGGSFYALSDDYNASYHYLTQSFTVPTTDTGARYFTLSFDMFVNHQIGVMDGKNGIADGVNGNNEYATVDLLSAGADPVTASILRNFYFGADGANGAVNPYTHYVFDITGNLIAGQTYELRFADSQYYYLQTGIDNVSLTDNPVPEPGTLLLLASGGIGIFGRLRRKVL